MPNRLNSPEELLQAVKQGTIRPGNIEEEDVTRPERRQPLSAIGQHFARVTVARRRKRARKNAAHIYRALARGAAYKRRREAREARRMN